MSAELDWQEVLSRHERWLRTVVFVRLDQSQAVDDVMQEIALAAVRQRAPLRDPSRLAPWLYRLALNQVLLFRRRRGRTRRRWERLVRRRPPAEFDAAQRDPLEWLLAAERQQMVQVALERLSRRDAEILLLKYTQDWTYRQISEHLGVSQSAVEARLHRARARLRAELTCRDAREKSHE